MIKKKLSLLLSLISGFFCVSYAEQQVGIEYSQQDLPQIYTTHAVYERGDSGMKNVSVNFKVSLPRLQAESERSLADRLRYMNIMLKEDVAMAERFPYFYMASMKLDALRAIKQHLVLNALDAQGRACMESFLTSKEREELKELAAFSEREGAISMYTIYEFNYYLEHICGGELTEGHIAQWDEEKVLDAMQATRKQSVLYEMYHSAAKGQIADLLQLCAKIDSTDTANEYGRMLGSGLMTLYNNRKKRQKLLDTASKRIPALATDEELTDDKRQLFMLEYQRFAKADYFGSEILENALLPKGHVDKRLKNSTPYLIAMEEAKRLESKRTKAYNFKAMSNGRSSLDFHVQGCVMDGLYLGITTYDMYFRTYFDDAGNLTDILVFDTENDLNACNDVSSAKNKNRLTDQDAFKGRLKANVNEELVREQAKAYNEALERMNDTPIPNLEEIMLEAVWAHENNHVDYMSQFPLYFLPGSNTLTGKCADKHRALLIWSEGQAVLAEVKALRAGIEKHVSDPEMQQKYLSGLMDYMFSAKIAGTSTSYRKAGQMTGKLYELTGDKQDDFYQMNSDFGQDLYKGVKECVEKYVKKTRNEWPHSSNKKDAAKKLKTFKCMSCMLGDTGISTCINPKCVNYGGSNKQ